MTAKNLVPTVLLSLSLLVVAATTAPVATILNFVEVQMNGAGNVTNLSTPSSITVTADGINVYATGKDSLVVFGRENVTGTLTYLESFVDNTGGVDGLDQAIMVAASPDNQNVYVASVEENGVGVFKRNTATLPLGTLEFIEAKKDGVGDVVDGLGGASAVAVSPDNKSVYVTGPLDDAVAVFSRDPLSGTLSFVEFQKDRVGGVQGVAGAAWVTVSPDNRHVYVTGNPAGVDDDALAVFARDTDTGELTFLEAHVNDRFGAVRLAGPESVAVSPDGKHVYVSADIDDAVTVFSRHPVSGTLTFVQSVENPPGEDVLDGAQSVVVSPDNKGVYVVTRLSNTLVVYRRDPLTGRLHFLELHRDNEMGVDGLEAAYVVAASSDNKNVYVVSNDDNAVSVFGRVGELPETRHLFLPVILQQ
jgi:6-phosphogluconolactonase (cycloisomerase 2 family)